MSGQIHFIKPNPITLKYPRITIFFFIILNIKDIPCSQINAIALQNKCFEGRTLLSSVVKKTDTRTNTHKYKKYGKNLHVSIHVAFFDILVCMFIHTVLLTALPIEAEEPTDGHP